MSQPHNCARQRKLYECIIPVAYHFSKSAKQLTNQPNETRQRNIRCRMHYGGNKEIGYWTEGYWNAIQTQMELTLW